MTRAAGSTWAVLALDQGSHASRACLVGPGGQVLAESELPVHTRHGADGRVEQDPRELVSSLRAAAREVLSRAGALRVLRAGLATQRSSIVCFDARTGAPLSAVISWQDRRNAAWLARLGSAAERVRELSGLPLSPHYGASKMRWCLDHRPTLRAAQRRGTLRIGPLAAYLVQQLTGAGARVDAANASRTQLWDIGRRAWSGELLGLFGIERALLPACVSTRGHFGLLRLNEPSRSRRQRAAPESAAVALRAVTGDQSAVPFAFGPPHTRSLYVNLGTGAFLQRPCRGRPHRPAPLLASVLACNAHRALYCLEGTVNGAGSAVSAFLNDEGIVTGSPAETGLWRDLDSLAAGAALPVYVNGIGGLGSPYWRARQPSCFLGRGTRLERFAAVLESIAFLIAINFRCLAGRAESEPLERVLLTGGLSRSDWLCRRIAVLIGVPVLRAAREATLLGAAALAQPRLLAAPLAGAARFEPRSLPGPDRAELRVRCARFETALSNP